MPSEEHVADLCLSDNDFDEALANLGSTFATPKPTATKASSSPLAAPSASTSVAPTSSPTSRNLAAVASEERAAATRALLSSSHARATSDTPHAAATPSSSAAHTAGASKLTTPSSSSAYASYGEASLWPALAHSDSAATCPNCQQLCEGARLLPCLHTFCAACVATFEKGHDEGCLRCPVCGHMPPAGKGRVEPNPLVQRLVEQRKNTETSCENCEIKSVKYYCTTCRSRFCEDCYAPTHGAKMFRSHVVVDVAKQDIKEKEGGTCRLHDGRPLRGFCIEDSALVCDDCVQQTHASHSESIKPVPEAAAKVRTALEKLSLGLQRRRDNLHSVMGTIDSKLNEANQSFDHVMLQVIMHFQECHRILEERETMILNSARAKMEAKVEGVRKSRTDIEVGVNTVDQTRRTLSHVIGAAHDYELLQVGNMFSRRLRDLGDLSFPLDVPSDFSVSATFDEQFVELARRHGTVRVGMEVLGIEDPTKTTAAPKSPPNKALNRSFLKSMSQSEALQRLHTHSYQDAKVPNLNLYQHVAASGNQSTVLYASQLRTPSPRRVKRTLSAHNPSRSSLRSLSIDSVTSSEAAKPQKRTEDESRPLLDDEGFGSISLTAPIEEASEESQQQQRTTAPKLAGLLSQPTVASRGKMTSKRPTFTRRVDD